MLTYHDLMAFWECPRLLVYRSLGFEPLELPDAMLRGLLVHRGIAAGWRGQSVTESMDTAIEVYLGRFEGSKLSEVKAKLQRLIAPALEMCTAYQAQISPALRPIHVEQPITVERVSGTPDAIGYVTGLDGKETLVVVELKTGEAPHVPVLVLQGQADFYAYLFAIANHDLLRAEAVRLDIISPKYCYGHQYSPNLERGFYLWANIEKLGHYNLWELAGEPHYSWRCASCDFFHPCQVKEAGGRDLEILEKEFYYDQARDKRRGKG